MKKNIKIEPKYYIVKTDNGYVINKVSNHMGPWASLLVIFCMILMYCAAFIVISWWEEYVYDKRKNKRN